jgi:hypothetical protein
MSKQQLIEAIRKQNRSATETFLIDFDESALTNYLNHLTFRHTPRGDGSVWVRTGETPAVVVRHS